MYKIIKQSTYDAILKEAVINADEAAKLRKYCEDADAKLRSSRAYIKNLEAKVRRLTKKASKKQLKSVAMKQNGNIEVGNS